MKKDYFIAIIIISIFSLEGCQPAVKKNNSLIKTIQVSTDNITSLKYNDYVSESHLIPLDKSNNQYLSSIKRLYVKNNKIAAISSNKVFIYNLENGRLEFFLDRLGKGPGEYVNVDDIFLDSESLYVLDKKKRIILEYDFQGKFINSISTNLIGYAFTKINPNVFAIYINSDISDESNYRLNIFSVKEKKVIEKFFRISDTEYNWQYVVDLRNFIQNKANTYFIRSFNDTVFSIKDEDIIPAYHIDFGNNRTPSDFLKKDYEDILDFATKASKNNYIYSVLGFHHTNDYIYFAYRFNNEFIHCIYSHRTGNSLSFNNFENFLNIPGLNEKTSFSNFPLTNDDEYFYAVIEPNSFKEKLKDKKVSYPHWISPIFQTSKDDNPFILKFKLQSSDF